MMVIIDVTDLFQSCGFQAIRFVYDDQIGWVCHCWWWGEYVPWLWLVIESINQIREGKTQCPNLLFDPFWGIGHRRGIQDAPAISKLLWYWGRVRGDDFGNDPPDRRQSV